MADQPTQKLILIVEDDQALSNLYDIKFKKEGFKTLVAHDGETGLKLALENSPLFVLLDNMLPKLNGLEVLKLIKEDQKGANIKVMVLSNLAEDTERDRALSLGAIDYLSKAGQSPEEVVNKVKSHIGGN